MSSFLSMPKNFGIMPDSYLEPPEDFVQEDEVDHIAISDRNGIYIPQLFASSYEKADNVSEEDWDCILAGPWITRRRPDLSPAELFINAWREFIAYGEWDWDCPDNMEEVPNEWYWEAWNNVESNWGYEQIDANGDTWEYYLHQDGDLFVMKRMVAD